MNKRIFQFVLITLLLSTSSIFFLLSAQGWVQTYHDARINDMVKDINGGYALLATNQLIKTDEQGNPIWKYTDGGEHLTQTNDSSYVFTDHLGSNSFKVVKVDPNGNLVWEKGFSDLNLFNPNKILPIVNTSDNHIAVAGYDTEYVQLFKLDNDGNTVWTSNLGDTTIAEQVHDMVEAPNGGFTLLIQQATGSIKLIGTNPDGTFNWTSTVSDSINAPKALITTNDGGYAICGQGYNNIFPTQSNPVAVSKTDSIGNELWTTIDYSTTGFGPSNYFWALTNLYQSYNLAEDTNGNIITAYIHYKGNPTTVDPSLGWGIANPAILKIAPGGTILLSKPVLTTPFQNEFTFDLQLLNDGFVALAGWRGDNGFLLLADSLGNTFSNNLNGQIKIDSNLSCTIDSLETPLVNWYVKATRTSDSLSFYSASDSSGHYNLQVDTGSYLIDLIEPNNLWDPCQDSISFSFSTFYDSLEYDFSIEAVANCPYLEVDLGTGFLRRCFDNDYNVSYCNNGTTTAEDAYIIVQLDPYLSAVSSTPAWDSIVGDSIFYHLGDIEPFECGTIDMVVYVDCDSTVLGQTHCSEARIYPDSLCVPIDPLWSGASLSAEAICTGDSVLFLITNTGTGNLPIPVSFIVIEDHMVLLQDNSQPAPGETDTVIVDANGSFYRIEVDQAPYHPGSNNPSAFVEGCDSLGSMGYVIQYPQNDADPFISIDCQENVGSWDPNDKQAFPKGREEEHYLEANTDLEYLIRFQNEGTDTAFTVVIVDSISNHLDMTTIRPGASSHPYSFEIQNEDVIIFTFNDILLPPKDQDELASQGYVKFRISQKPDNPIGTVIENNADIYFDFNEPIRTNTTWNTIGEELTLVSIEEPTNVNTQTSLINVAPNPFADYTYFEIDHQPGKDYRFQLFNQQGALIKQDQIQSNQYQFNRENLPAGLYFFTITQDGELMGRGKMAMQ